ncbi:tight junction ZO-1-like isoform X4 [Labeo rohita]|uniref:Tight junction ZO-1-like isoform X4 n=1 Tax=Labeo rohita TaxID=84645 RepID=A0A498M650_LABRO|nr:tight junction ZO-1-like isoform X4 [Labeo rohita]RXN16071.1 tight junction ZO-1-like isoform X4 [Labeo rohita]
MMKERAIPQHWKWRSESDRGGPGAGGCQGIDAHKLTYVGFVVVVLDNMKYQKYITVMQMAMGVTASNKDDCIPPKRQLWVPPDSDAPAASATSAATPPAAAASQGKPSLRRIKGRIHRSKSLDSIDLLDCNIMLLLL